MELNRRYDPRGDQFLLYVEADDTYGLEGRLVAHKKSANDEWRAFDGMSLVLREYEETETKNIKGGKR
jgi:hypothetical protein